MVYHCSILLPVLRLTPPVEGFPRTISVKLCTDVKGMAKVQNGEEIAESFNPLSRAHERYRRQTDYRRICDSKDLNVT